MRMIALRPIRSEVQFIKGISYLGLSHVSSLVVFRLKGKSIFGLSLRDVKEDAQHLHVIQHDADYCERLDWYVSDPVCFEPNPLLIHV
jgi:hypothetical protein